MSPDPRDSPALKIARAKHHIEDLNRQAAAYCKEGHYRFVVQDDGESNKRTITTRIDQPTRDTFAPILGDAVHNLRATLDLAFWSIMAPHVASPSDRKKLYFPIRETAEGLEFLIAKGVVQNAPKKVHDALRAIKPYPGGNDDLCGLHDLDITDKHKLILPVMSDLGIDRLNLVEIDPSGPSFSISNFNIVGYEGKVLDLSYPRPVVPTRARVQRRLDQQAEKNITFAVRFSAEGPFASEPVIPTLLRLVGVVETAVEILRAAQA